MKTREAIIVDGCERASADSLPQSVLDQFTEMGTNCRGAFCDGVCGGHEVLYEISNWDHQTKVGQVTYDLKTGERFEDGCEGEMEAAA